MKQVININFHGQVVPIEVSAFDLLKNYTDSLSRYFANEEGKEEIINDIESRIGELFQERLKKGATCITDDDVNAIIKSMGSPEEFEGDEEKAASGLGAKAEEKSYSSAGSGADTTATHKRLFRDENNKVIGGVCGGLANYFGTDPVIIRVIFAVVALAFGTGLLAYIILWIAVPSSASTVIGASRKKLFRDPDNKIIAGVCSGIGNYFGVSAWIARVLFLLPFLSFVFNRNDWDFFGFHDFFNFSFSPGSLIVYIILWLVIPEAGSTAEKLEMKGEKVDMNSIKNSVVGEMKGVQQRAEKFAKEATAVAGEKSRVMGGELKSTTKRGISSLGDVIILLVKIFAYFIIGTVSIAMVVGLFAVAIVSIGVFPLKDFLLTDGWQNALAWGTLLFFIAVPVIGIITWIIRRLAKMKSNRKILRASFISLWVVGWVCFICLVASISKDFKSINNVNEQDVLLSNPSINKLEVTTNSPLKNTYRYNHFRLEPFEGWDDDTVNIKNTEVKIVKSANDSFRVTIMKIVNGRTKRFADTLANLIEFNAVQKDSLLVVDKGITINRKDKFRNQRVVVTVYVPVGKKIRINRSVAWGNNDIHFDGPWNDGDYFIDREDEESGWDANTDYIMKADGLHTLDGRHAGESDKDDSHSKVKIGPDGIEINDNGNKINIDKNGVRMNDAGGDNYRYDNNKAASKEDSLKMKSDKEKQQAKDSLQKVKEGTEKKVVTANSDDEGRQTMSSYKSVMYIPMVNLD